MNESRLAQLLQFYKEDPDDPFNIYALANEYKDSDWEKALKYFEKLVTDHPEYTATYYHLAHLYIELDKENLAKETFEKGIEIASKKSEHFALRELKSAYEEFMMDE